MKPLVIIFGKDGKRLKFFIGFKEQFDMEKQPLFCLFYMKTEKDSEWTTRQRTDRIFTLGGKE